TRICQGSGRSHLYVCFIQINISVAVTPPLKSNSRRPAIHWLVKEINVTTLMDHFNNGVSSRSKISMAGLLIDLGGIKILLENQNIPKILAPFGRRATFRNFFEFRNATNARRIPQCVHEKST